MMRLSTSRPKRSVPSGWSQVPRSIQTGGISFVVMSPSVGLWGARTPAKAAVRTRRSRMPPGNQGSCLPRTADPRVEVAVEEVHAQVAEQVERAEHEHAGLHDRIVARGHALE